MITPIQQLIDSLEKEIKYVNKEDSPEDKYWQQGMKHARDIALELLKQEKRHYIDFANKCTLINDIDPDGNVSFCFVPETLYEYQFNNACTPQQNH